MAISAVAAVLVGLALIRAPDHDESQYVASAVLVSEGLLPYRDFAYLQTPLQPLLFAPIVAVAGHAGWIALRLVNALLGTVMLAATHRAALAAGARRGTALAATGLMASCDVFLFAVGTARNDILPAALLSLALIVLVDPRAVERRHALAAGFLLAAAAAAKVSYAVPAVAVGLWSLLDRRRRPVALLAGALPVAALCGAIAATNPTAAWFEIVRFPADAPSRHYAAVGLAWKVSAGVKLLDLVKFLLLGPAMLALALVLWRRPRCPAVAWVLLTAGLAAAALPTPTWRQYLLPALPPLFVLLAVRWTELSPTRAGRGIAGFFAIVGVLPTLVGVATGARPFAANAAARAVGAALDRAGASGPVATLSPQFLPALGRAPDRRFVTGPFYFRDRAMLAPGAERAAALLAHDRLARAPLPSAVLVGGEGEWTAGDARVDAVLEAEAIARGYRRVDGRFGPFRLYLGRCGVPGNGLSAAKC